jgi:hypothetical protein
MQLAEFYGWSIDEIRALTILEYEAARRYLAEVSQKKR